MPVSSLSSTMIGHGQSEAHRHAVAQSHYRNEASKISEHISGLHPSRRQKIMQVQYPTTVSRLSCGPSSGISATHSQQQQSSLSSHDSNSALPRASTLRKVESEKQFHERRSVELREEYSLNDRKKRFNRSCGTHAVVSDILHGHGSGSVVQEPLFPQKANHQQALMITGKLTMPDARIVPPDVPRPKKWLGNEMGWQK